MTSSTGAPGEGEADAPTRRTTTVAERTPASVATPATPGCPMNAGETPRRRCNQRVSREDAARPGGDESHREPGHDAGEGGRLVGTWRAYPNSPPNVTKRPTITVSCDRRRRESDSTEGGDGPGPSLPPPETGEPVGGHRAPGWGNGVMSPRSLDDRSVETPGPGSGPEDLAGKRPERTRAMPGMSDSRFARLTANGHWAIPCSQTMVPSVQLDGDSALLGGTPSRNRSAPGRRVRVRRDDGEGRGGQRSEEPLESLGRPRK